MSTEVGAENAIHVICCGLGRTGTLSLSEALNTLGFKSYHFIDFNHHKAWAEVACGKRSVDDVIDLIVQDGYTATVENPTCDIYTELLRRYPNAKVILTVREPSAWVKSWKMLFETMIITEQRFSLSFPSFFGYIPLFNSLRQLRQYMGTTHLGLTPGALTHGWRSRDDKWLAEQYQRHNQHVQKNVPESQLLVFDVKEGWEPLCMFLGKEIPKQAFPHCTINNSKSLLKMRRQFLTVVYGWIPTTLAVVVGTLVWFRNKASK